MFYKDPPYGETTIDDIYIPENAVILSTEFGLKGSAYTGNINQEVLGTTVEAVGNKNSTNTFIVDFHTFRTICGVFAVVYKNEIEKVNMWLGVNFFSNNSEGTIKPNLITNNPSNISGIIYFDEISTTKLKVSLKNGQSMSIHDFKTGFKVFGRSFPLNLKVKIGNEDSFWACPGEFSSEVALPDFSDALNRYKESCENDSCQVPLILMSDAPGNICVTKKIGYHLDKVQINGNDIAKITLVANNRAEINMLPPSFEQNNLQIVLDRLGFDIEGVLLSDYGVKVSPTFNAAKKIEPQTDLKLQGFKILLGKELSPDLELFAELQTDQDNRPLADEVLVSVPIKIDHKAIEHDFWLNVNFEETVELISEKKYWLVLKSKNGTAEWKAYLPPKSNKSTGFKFTKNAGETWLDHQVTGYCLLLSDPPCSDGNQWLSLGIKVENYGVTKSINIKVGDEASPIEPITFPENTTLNVDGKIVISIEGEQYGFVRISNAFIDFYITHKSDV